MQKKSNISRMFEGRSTRFWIITNSMLVSVLGLVDYLTGNEFSFSLFYLIPITLTAWYANRTLGNFIAVFSAITWLAADIAAGADYSYPILYFWNTLIRFSFFIIITYLVSELHKTQKTVEALARTDYTTGTVNALHFHELLETRLERAHENKRPFTLVYLDLDNFKQVNDKFGHEEGDAVIRLIAAELKGSVRSTDIVSRQGGDEFAILFSDAGQLEAEVIMNKINARITELLSQKHSFVTFSAGAVTYLSAPNSSSETIKIADQLMYSVKNSTKNGILYSVYTG